MKILLIGDIVGKPGKTIVQRALPGLRVEAGLDFIVANAENIAGGSGITPKIYRELKAAGVDCVTMGDHIYRRSEIDSLLNDQHQIVKPANFPRTAPGRDWAVVTAANGVRVAVFSLLGRLFMRPVDCPWTRADQILQELPAEGCHGRGDRRFQASRIANAIRPAVQLDLLRVDFQDLVQRQE